MGRWGKAILGNLHEILKFTQTRVRHSFNELQNSQKNGDPFGYGRIFQYFPFWQTRFEIEGSAYGGETDYSRERISPLNLPEIQNFFNVKDLSILELGPLEGGNTLKLCQMGARKVTAIEGRPENFIKCCVIKNLYGLEEAKFYLDDVRKISQEKYGTFDMALVAGILYHLDDPHLLLNRLSQMTDVLLLATHYADEASPFPTAQVIELSTEFGTYRGKVYSEGAQVNINSGLQPTSFWPFENDLLQMCKDIGFKDITVLKKNPIPSEPFKVIFFIAKK
ncbi:MAG TPA: class I SAM-dependent methyltransferase [Nitrospiria bacterium]